MKPSLLIIFIIVTKINCFSQSIFEKKLYTIDSSINENLYKYNYELVDLEDSEFQLTLFNYFSKNPKSISEEFEYLKKTNVLNIITSKDGKFKIYNWDTRTGGTMHFFQAIIQYKTSKGINIEILGKKAEDPLCYFDRIEQVLINKKLYYLPIGRGIYSNQDFGSILMNFTISNNKIISTTKLFQPKGKAICEILVPYNWFLNENLNQYTEKQFIKFTDNMKTLSIAIIDEKGKFTGNYFKYILLNGKYRYIK